MKKFLIVFTITALVLLAADFTACSYYVDNVVKSIPEGHPASSDVIIIFFGDHDHNLELGRETLKRLNHGADLYARGAADYIVCTGGKGLSRDPGISGSALMKEFLMCTGIPEGSITAEVSSYDSFSNWENTAGIIKKNGWGRVILVSSALHLFRLADMAQGDSLEVALSPYSREGITSFRDYWRKRSWIHHEWIAISVQKVLPKTWYTKLLRWVRT
ncbi:YdcF family protein [Candidatus Latescibacterota bacterium]